MQPGHRAVKVKDVIGALCSLLTAGGVESVPTPEGFRRAKFNCGSEDEQFWQLLANVLQTSNIVSAEAFSQLTGASDWRALVALGMWQIGYHAEWICVTEGEESIVGSRDLLLALGWLLATGTLDRVLLHRTQQLDITLLNLPAVNLLTPQATQLDHASLRRLQWLIGCLRFQRRSLLSVQEERARLLHAVLSVDSHSSYSFSSSSSQISSALQKECTRLQELFDLLEAFVNWKHVEKLFWAWMDSVLDCHLLAKVHPAVDSARLMANRSSAGCLHGNQGLERLDNMLLGLPTAQRGQSRENEPRRKRSADQPTRKLGGDGLQQASGSSALSPLLAAPLLLHHPVAALPQIYRISRLQGERPASKRFSPPEDPADGAWPAGKVQALQACRLLLRLEARLQERRDTSRLASRMQLQEIIGHLDALVLIPP